jgi:hypothetical protein
MKKILLLLSLLIPTILTFGSEAKTVIFNHEPEITLKGGEQAQEEMNEFCKKAFEYLHSHSEATGSINGELVSNAELKYGVNPEINTMSILCHATNSVCCNN